jgi:type IV pilus assembly protein PilN
MIRINLASNMKGAASNTTTSFTLGSTFGSDSLGDSDIKRRALIRMLVVFLPVIGLYSYEYISIPELKSSVRSKSSYLSDLKQKNLEAQGAVDEIEKFRKDKDRLQLQIDTLEGLASERSKEVKVLDTIQRDIPSRVWLTKVVLSGDQMTLQGYSTADLETTNFMDSLSKSVHLKEVRLIKSFEQQFDGSVSKVFEIGLVIDRSKIRPAGISQ